MDMARSALHVDVLRQIFGDAVQENISLAPYTSARIGGPADVLLTVKSADEFAEAMKVIWENDFPYYILGGGSNVLVSDLGLRGVVVLNRAKEVRFEGGDQPTVWCEAGVIFSNLANRCASKGLAGLEWAATVPGTVGGAVYGNAGAFGGDVSMNLIWADVLTKNGRERMSVEQMGYGYRTSVLKRGEIHAIVLSALLRLKNSAKEEVSVKIEQFSERRKATQPPGASMGSMFKNPEGDHAGRLIEAAGLKGVRIGNAEISTLHGNFFINHGETRAKDILALIRLTQKTVREKFGVQLELEVELVGDWNE
ncbi:MAG TPA: UDP-N-acetylmuramate dehydrogenase [Anaerolineales bacterium]|nr:UDP-N-acetylmuramate dehydrogenase [Anaerolineales bacterium]HMV94855.1 UDP-N-acetylmuramate dehydrogenase [Anaerolineales bacterium]HMX17842.1 UDP-N-acetylmuramate dehydrogenase [Anaerolineales bacterium]HMX72837.1 UDP-N-acetylmuramate dehydrogenase [Anaerolineales bacterium]HMZ43274.1 UDP-N-acetylmuramate dehydrogenase [Anaerolineales bacterium]